MYWHIGMRSSSHLLCSTQLLQKKMANKNGWFEPSGTPPTCKRKGQRMAFRFRPPKMSKLEINQLLKKHTVDGKKILHHLRCPKRSWYWYKTNILGHPKWCRISEPSTVSHPYASLTSRPWKPLKSKKKGKARLPTIHFSGTSYRTPAKQIKDGFSVKLNSLKRYLSMFRSWSWTSFHAGKKNTCLAILSDLLKGWLNDPLKWLSDLQLGDEKVTLHHLVMAIMRSQVTGEDWRSKRPCDS